MSQTIQVNPPYVPIMDLTGRGLNAGSVYIGAPGLDPVTNPQAVYWDIALTIPATQPLDVEGGYIMRLGTPANAYTSAPYSIKATDRNGSQVFYMALFAPYYGPPPQGYISGLTLSTAGGSGTFGVAAGQATDSTGTATISLASAFTKTTSSWAAGSGNGGLDTGSIANNTWYHVYVMLNPSTWTTGVIFSLSASAPTLPSGYTLYRRIGAMKTDGSAHWTAFFQVGNQFTWAAPVTDMNAVTGNTTPAAYALTVPPGVNVTAIGNALLVSASGVANILFYSPTTGTQAANSPSGNISLYTPASGGSAGQVSVMTDTSQHIEFVASATTANIVAYWVTTGWVDFRGQV